ncbi:hypothetical protein EQ500_03590 [Lactobacillus sp. XV13L]|nr:hypothetical protein [Lactobacillus sp. XV13L]
MIIDTEKLQKRVIANKVKHNFSTGDVKFELLRLYGEVNELFEAWTKRDQANIDEGLAHVPLKESPRIVYGAVINKNNNRQIVQKFIRFIQQEQKSVPNN